MFIHPDRGSFFLLAEVLCCLELEFDRKIQVNPKTRTKLGGCGTCRRCQVHCPTGALSKDYILDANKCIAYYTIEHRGPIPVEFWQGLKRYFFGCDICQLVCPYNKTSEVVDLAGLKKSGFPRLSEIALMDQKQYEEWFGGTPMTRAKKDGLRRNSIICMVVNHDPEFARIKGMLSNDASDLVKRTIEQITEYEKLTSLN